jgi:predicted nucleic acid-binding protein
MIVYLDSSVLLRRLLGQPNALREWRLIRTGVSSRLAEVECLRTLDRLRLDRVLDERRLATLRERLHEVLRSLEIVEVTRSVLSRASQPSPTSLGTLDSIHLSSAILWREHTGKNPVLATHDEALALGARAEGLRTLGV